MATQDVKIRITALDKVSGPLKKIGTGLRALTKPLFSMKTALAGLLGAGGFTLLVRQSLLATDALSKTANKIGTTTEALSKLQFAAKLSGVETSTLNMAMQRFTRRLSEAARGTGEARGALRELNIDARALQQMPLDDQMLVLSRAFGEVGTESDKVRLAFKLFDSEGVALVNMLKEGENNLRGFFDQAEAVGIVMSGKAAAGVERANDAFFVLSSIFKGILDQTTAALAPALEYIAKSLSDTMVAFGEAQEGFTTVGKTIAENLIGAFSFAAKGIFEIINNIIDAYNSISSKVINIALVVDRKELRALEEQQEAMNELIRIRKKLFVDRQELTKKEHNLLTTANEEGLVLEQHFADAALEIERQLAEKRQQIRQRIADGEGIKPVTMKSLFGFSEADFDEFIKSVVGKVKGFKLELSEPPKAPEMNLPNKYIESLKDLDDKLPETEDLVVSFANNTMNSFTQGFTNAITGAEKFGDAIKNMAKSVVDDLIRMAIQYYITQRIFGAIVNAFQPQPLVGPTGIEFGPAADHVGARAMGGPVTGGRPYLVGERGPELMVPSGNGTVVPNNALGGGGVTVVQNINVTTGVQQTVRAEIANLLPQISNAAKSAVADARMRGGGFSKAMVGV